MNYGNQQFEFLDIITILSVIIQVIDHTLLVEQASNDDILKELKKDMTILQNQNREILEMLRNLIENNRIN